MAFNSNIGICLFFKLLASFVLALLGCFPYQQRQHQPQKHSGKRDIFAWFDCDSPGQFLRISLPAGFLSSIIFGGVSLKHCFFLFYGCINAIGNNSVSANSSRSGTEKERGKKKPPRLSSVEEGKLATKFSSILEWCHTLAIHLNLKVRPPKVVGA
jgi:hypothetical protein